jgi:hypothetical protein
VRTLAKYLYALKNPGKKLSLMNDIDCLHLKRNFAWWLFSGIQLSFEDYKESVMGLCGLWRKKEYPRMRQKKKKVKLDRRLQTRKKMLEGVAKVEKDVDAGQGYALGIRIAASDENGKENDKMKANSGQQEARKRARTANNNADNKRTAGVACNRCGGWDHKRVSSKHCQWRGLSAKEVAEKVSSVNNKTNGELTNEKGGGDYLYIEP